MREIKFRAFDIVEKAIHEIQDIVFYDKADECGMKGEVFYAGDSCSKYFGENTDDFDMEQCKIMQFTGLQDKNGKDIYEGDILDLSCADRIKDNQYIFYNRGRACFCRTKGEGYGYSDLNSSISTHYGVIGNIYENPELIK